MSPRTRTTRTRTTIFKLIGPCEITLTVKNFKIIIQQKLVWRLCTFCKEEDAIFSGKNAWTTRRKSPIK